MTKDKEVIEERKEGGKESLDDRLWKKTKKAGRLVLGIIVIAILFEMRPRGIHNGGWWLYLAFVSIPLSFMGIFEKVWVWLKSNKELQRVVYCIAIITYLGVWSTVIVDKFLSSPARLNVNVTTPSNLDINLKTPSYAPIKIENKHTYEGKRGY